VLQRNANSQEAVGSSLSHLVKVYATTAEVKQEEVKANIALSKHNAAVAACKERREFRLAKAEMRAKERAQALEMTRSDIQEVREMGTVMLRELLSAAKPTKDGKNSDDELQDSDE
jgi:glutamate racemase